LKQLLIGGIEIWHENSRNKGNAREYQSAANSALA
jgi:hypothetical protein